MPSPVPMLWVSGVTPGHEWDHICELEVSGHPGAPGQSGNQGNLAVSSDSTAHAGGVCVSPDAAVGSTMLPRGWFGQRAPLCPSHFSLLTTFVPRHQLPGAEAILALARGQRQQV